MSVLGGRNAQSDDYGLECKHILRAKFIMMKGEFLRARARLAHTTQSTIIIYNNL
jgi:hypothetical protein